MYVVIINMYVVYIVVVIKLLLLREW